MSDLFHKDVPPTFISAALDVMRQAKQHTFIVLTKRPENLKWLRLNGPIYGDKPLPNVWLGVTAENQQMANERIPLLLQIPAVVRFVSVEPLLGPIDLMSIPFDKYTTINVLEGCGISTKSPRQSIPNAWCNKLDWVICGCESGPGRRPMHRDWARYLKISVESPGCPSS